MKDTILIPTDFSIASLNLVKQALTDHPEAPIDLLLVFECRLTDSITDLIFLSKKSLIDGHMSADFQDGIDILKNRFADNIRTLRIEPFFGFTNRAFRDFATANDVVHAYIPSTEALTSAHREMAQLCQYIQKNALPHTSASWKEQQDYNQSEASVFQLFNA